MKTHLVIGLGNPLMGDDGIGVRVARELSGDSRLEAFEICDGGTDLLRHQPRFGGRKSVSLIDGTIDGLEPGTLTLISGEELSSCSPRHPHCLCLSECLSLIQFLQPELGRIPFTLFLISVPRAEICPELSPILRRRLPSIVEEIRSFLSSGDKWAARV